MKGIFSIMMLLIGYSASAQTAVQVERYQYENLINERKIGGKITGKFTAYKEGNPVNFIVLDKIQVHVWEVPIFEKLRIGQKFEFVGITPLEWAPTFSPNEPLIPTVPVFIAGKPVSIKPERNDLVYLE